VFRQDEQDDFQAYKVSLILQILLILPFLLLNPSKDFFQVVDLQFKTEFEKNAISTDLQYSSYKL